MQRSTIAPHISWSGPQPQKEMDAYLLAMLLRIYASGLEREDEAKRDMLRHPSVLTTNNIHTIAIMYAYYQEKMEEDGIRNTENMLKLIKSCEDECVSKWLPGASMAVTKAEGELIEYVDTPSNKGFSAFG